MTSRRRVEDQQVGRLLSFELFDLAEHEDVADARHGGRHHVQRATRHEPAGDPAHRMILEVLDQSIVGRQRSRPHLACSDRSVVSPPEHDLVVAERLAAEHRGETALALDLDDEGAEAAPSGGAGQRG